MVDTHSGRPPYIGVDLDGTLAEYHGWRGMDHIGLPVRKMAERVHRWVMSGRTVKIITARMAEEQTRDQAEHHIRLWLAQHFNPAVARCEITCVKGPGMIELWDDRAVQVEENTGRRMDGRE